MSYCGRVEVRIMWDGEGIEDSDVDFMPQRGWYGDAIIREGIAVEDMFGAMLKGRTAGWYDIAGRYFEEFHQDYEGEWDGEWRLEGERVRYRGPLAPEKL